MGRRAKVTPLSAKDKEYFESRNFNTGWEVDTVKGVDKSGELKGVKKSGEFAVLYESDGQLGNRL
jgi:hypothetical protein